MGIIKALFKGNKKENARRITKREIENMKKEVWGEKACEQNKIWNKVTEYNLKTEKALKNKDYDEAKRLCKLGIKWAYKLENISSLNYPFVTLGGILEKQNKHKECMKLSDEYLKIDANNEYFIKLRKRASDKLKERSKEA